MLEMTFRKQIKQVDVITQEKISMMLMNVHVLCGIYIFILVHIHAHVYMRICDVNYVYLRKKIRNSFPIFWTSESF